MKNLSFTLFILFAIAILYSSCSTPEQKKAVADAKVIDAQENLNKTMNNADKASENVATAEELKTFRLEYDLRIKNNEAKIANLKLKINKSNDAPDTEYTREIDSLQYKNTNLKKRLADYEKTHSDWSKFKNDFNRDLDDLGNRLKKIAKKD